MEKTKLVVLAAIISTNSVGFILAGSWLNGIGVGLSQVLEAMIGSVQ